MEASLPILFDKECEIFLEKFPTSYNVSTQLCAGRGGPDTCRGDSGIY